MTRPRIGELLVSSRALTQEKLDEALRMPRAPGQRLGALLVQMSLVSETQVTQILGQQLAVPWVSLYHIDFSRQLLNLVPREVAEKYCLVPIYVRRVRKQGETLYVAMDDPTNEGALAEVSQHAGLPTQPMIACPSDIRSAIRVYYGASEPSMSMMASPPVSDQLAPIAPSSASRVPQPAPAAPAKPPVPQATSASASQAPVVPQRPRSASGDHPDDDPVIEAKEVEIRRAPRPMIAIAMLDGTTIHLPARGGASDPAADAQQMTARDLVRALRAVAQGKNPADLNFDLPKTEEILAALISTLLRKRLIADWEFIEELKKVRRVKTSEAPKEEEGSSPDVTADPPKKT